MQGAAQARPLTVPVPLPANVTVSGWFTGAPAWKRAVTERARSIVT